MNTEKRYKRQSTLLPNEMYTQPVTVIGCGAIGNQLCMQLASVGIQNIHVIDEDKVDIVNLANQGFAEKDLDTPKINAAARRALEINSKINFHCHEFMLSEPTIVKALKEKIDFQVTFCCVDSIEARGNIYKAIKDKNEVFIDGRMSAESMRIISTYPRQPEGPFDYESTLFKQSEAQGGACTAKSTIYCANVAAGMMLSQYTKILRGIEPECDIILNLLGNVMEIL